MYIAASDLWIIGKKAAWSVCCVGVALAEIFFFGGVASLFCFFGGVALAGKLVVPREARLF